MTASLPHLGLAPGSLPRQALVAGDPARLDGLAAGWTGVRELANTREFRVLVGESETGPRVAASHGIGGSSAEIALAELHACGVNNVIRVGTCGALGANVAPGDTIIAEACLRLGTAEDDYVARGFPAVADRGLTNALAMAAGDTPHHVGLMASTASFYTGQARPAPFENGSENKAFLDDLRRQKVLGIEMEGAALMVLGRLWGLRIAMLCTAGPNRTTGATPLPPQKAEAAFARVAKIANKALDRV